MNLEEQAEAMLNFGSPEDVEQRKAMHSKMVREYMEASPIPETPGKLATATALANLRMMAMYLNAKLIAEGGLRGEPLRIATGVNSGISRLCKTLQLVPEKANTKDEDEF